VDTPKESTMKLIKYPDPILDIQSEPILETELEYIKSIVPDMAKIMKDNNGIGLAGVQVGILKTFCIMYNQSTQGIDLIINPVILNQDSEMIKGEEGCLSLPLFWESIERPLEVTAEFMEENWQKVRAVFYGLEARCLIHELEHMIGQPIHNLVSPMKKHMWEKKLIKKGLL